jgi:hypothetical protein
MANIKITDLTAYTDAASTDVLPIVDVSSNITRKISISTLLKATPLGSAAAPAIAIDGDPNTGIYSPGADTIAVSTGGSERARIDSSGRLLVGTSSALANIFTSATAVTPQIQLSGAGLSESSLSLVRTGGAVGATIFLNAGSSGNNVIGGSLLGRYIFNGFDGTNYRTGAQIFCEVDGTPGTNDMPGRLVFSTTADGASSPTERLRITNDGVRAYDQLAPAAVNATATLTVANLKTGIITSTSAAATDMTLPTGTNTQAGFSDTYDNMTFEWSVINTGPSLVRVLAGTAHTIIGSGSVATGTSGRFASRRTANNTFVTYRLS